jgi:hypothetical protein
MTVDRDHTSTDVQFLDLVVAAAEKWKALLAIPILVGVTAYLIANSQPNIYETKVTLFMVANKQGSSFSRELIQRALKDTSYAADAVAVTSALTFDPYVHVVGSVVKRPVSLNWKDRQAAYDILQAIVSQYNKEFLEKYRSEYIANYQHQIDMGEVEIKDRQALRERLSLADEGPSNAIAAAPTNKAALVALTTSIEERQRLRAELLRLTNNLPNTMIIEPVKAPVSVQGSKPVAEAIGSALAAFALFFAYLAFAERVKREAMTPAGIVKVARIRKVLPNALR